MAENADHAATSLGLIALLARVARHEVGAAVAGTEMRAGHFVVLTTLREHGAATQRTLSTALRLDPSSMVGLLNDLEERGLVARRRDPADRRRHIVEIEELGRRRLLDAEAHLAPAEDHVLHALSADERRALHALLARAVRGHAPTATCAAAAAAAPSTEEDPGTVCP